MYRIRTFDKISEKGLAIFDKAIYGVSPDEKNPDAIILRSHVLEADEIGGGVMCIARAGAGYNNIPVDLCSGKGIVVFNTPGANANAVKELVLCSLFLSARDVVGGILFAISLKDSDDPAGAIEKGKSRFMGPELKEKNLGVIGLGAIGVMVANAALELGMSVYGYDPYLSVESAWDLSGKVKKASSPEEVYKHCDYITFHIPLVESTKEIIGRESIGKMKEGVRILNFSRGGLADESALLGALDSGKVERYVTDFPGKALLGHPKAVCIPHLGASTSESEENCATMAASQIREYMENGNVVNSVNFPKCIMEPTSPGRLTVAHRNVPNMLGQILALLEKQNIKVEDMLNKGKGDYAYTIVNTCSEIGEDVLESVNAIDGVLRARTIK
ncbi:MAG: phosphoglycerate dehydrogenase [Clostridia bacterium]